MGRVCRADNPRLVDSAVQGDEELAREALSRRQQQVEVAQSLGEQMQVQTGAINKLFTSMQQLEAKITEAKVRMLVLPHPHSVFPERPSTPTPAARISHACDQRLTGQEGPDDCSCAHGQDVAEGERHALLRDGHHLHGRLRAHEGEGESGCALAP